jgi:hypothetical protein
VAGVLGRVRPDPRLVPVTDDDDLAQRGELVALTNSAPTTRTRAAASSRMNAISRGASRQLTATVTAPSFAAPNWTSKNSGVFLSSTATRSPAATPADRSAWATRLDRASSAP